VSAPLRYSSVGCRQIHNINSVKARFVMPRDSTTDIPASNDQLRFFLTLILCWRKSECLPNSNFSSTSNLWYWSWMCDCEELIPPPRRRRADGHGWFKTFKTKQRPASKKLILKFSSCRKRRRVFLRHFRPIIGTPTPPNSCLMPNITYIL